MAHEQVDGTHLGLAKEMGRGRSSCKAWQDLVNHRTRLWPPSMNNWMHNLSISRRKSSNEPEKERLYVCIVDLLISRCNFQCRDKSVNLDKDSSRLDSTKWFIPRRFVKICRPNVVEFGNRVNSIRSTKRDVILPSNVTRRNVKGRIHNLINFHRSVRNILLRNLTGRTKNHSKLFLNRILRNTRTSFLIELSAAFDEPTWRN